MHDTFKALLIAALALTPRGLGAQPSPTPPRPLTVPWPDAPLWRERYRVPDEGHWRLGARRWRWFTLRVGPGISALVAGPGDTVAFALDLDLGGVFGLHRGERQWGLVPLVGYTFRTPGDSDQLSAGLGVAWGVKLDTDQRMLTTRAVYDLDTAHFGLRVAALYRFAENGFSVELGYQTVPADERHELRATLGVDLGLLVAAVVDP